uniref:Transcription elongation factor, mitochondrial n=1 Tax=Timema douglasi TaxID=61478 RepID=A0A7R8VDA7_TIMDO|nr:unnamed protein product [Timema douglasi]
MDKVEAGVILRSIFNIDGTSERVNYTDWFQVILLPYSDFYAESKTQNSLYMGQMVGDHMPAEGKMAPRGLCSTAEDGEIEMCRKALMLFYDSSRNSSSRAVPYQSPYTGQQQQEILQKLNDSDAKDLGRLALTQKQVKKLENYRKEHGDYLSLSDVLRIEGFGVRNLKRLCDSILCISPDTPAGKAKRQRLVVTPELSEDLRKCVQKVVSVHVGMNCISWASLTRTGSLLDWGFHPLLLSSKRHPTALFLEALSIERDLPTGDVYVMEDKLAVKPSGQQSHVSSVIHLQGYQLSAMLLTLLNLREHKETLLSPQVNFDQSPGDPSPSEWSLTHLHKVYYLRSRVTARLFQTIVGSERVSAQSMVQDILTCQGALTHFTPVTFPESLKKEYLTHESVDKELLCLALLLAMSFMDLVVHRRSDSFAFLNRHSLTLLLAMSFMDLVVHRRSDSFAFLNRHSNILEVCRIIPKLLPEQIICEESPCVSAPVEAAVASDLGSQEQSTQTSLVTIDGGLEDTSQPISQ